MRGLRLQQFRKLANLQQQVIRWHGLYFFPGNGRLTFKTRVIRYV